MKNQFFYTRKEILSADAAVSSDGKPVIKTYKESFNINKVIRSLTLSDGKYLVLLDDIHERAIETPKINLKTNKVIGKERKRDTYQTEIFLGSEDVERFEKLTSINE